MTERPILFSGPMVRALIAGTKTQTRRVVKEAPTGPAAYLLGVHQGVWGIHADVDRDDGVWRGRCPYGAPGDQLRVKEAAWMWCERKPNGKTATGRDKWHYVPMREAPVHYAADHPARPAVNIVSPNTGNQWGWRLKIGRFLPAWASRIAPEVTEVRVERLQDISEADCIAEGVEVRGGMFTNGSAAEFDTGRDAYRALWESINGDGSWEASPWVWCVSFRRING